MKHAIIDIGELGWSLYLSAHALWLKEQGLHAYALTFKDRFGLYIDRVDGVIEVPCSFTERFGNFPQDGAGRRGVSDAEVWIALKDYFPETCKRSYKFGCDWSILKRVIYRPYRSSLEEYDGKMRILIFPRCRNEQGFEFRNLSKEFYYQLIYMLREQYPDKLITVIGSESGAYSFPASSGNFENLIGKTTIQNLINLCNISVVAIGGTSAPPKITLLQGVPTFIIGHERKRFTEDENWSKTKVGFYDILKKGYQDFNIEDCLVKIKEFVDESFH